MYPIMPPLTMGYAWTLSSCPTPKRGLCCSRDYERLADTLKGLHFLAFAMLMAHRFVQAMAFCL
jgi:hypothetical protein